MRWLAMVGETPDLLVGCTGGGSNFGGLSFPFLREKLAGRMNPTKRFPRNPSEMGYLGVPLAAGGAAGIGSLVDPSKYQPEAR